MTVEELFALDPAEFVKARDALAKELRAAGKRDDAAIVKALRRPTVPAWALNQVSRQHSDNVSALLDAASAARAAQEEVLAGADGSVLRDAMSDRRAQLRSVLHLARDVVERSGRSADTQERELEVALNAIIDSPALEDDFRRGRLTDVRVARDDDADDLSQLLAASAAMAPGQSPDDSAAEQLRAREAEEEAARERVAAARQSVAEADAQLEHARETVAAAKRALRDAEAEHRSAVRAVEKAERAATKR